MRKKPKDKSAITPAQCLFYYIIWGVLISAIYKAIVFITVSGFSTKQSTILFLMCIGCSCVFGGRIRWRKCMTKLGIAEDILVGIGVYTDITYIKYYTKPILIVDFICFALIIVAAYLYLSKKYKGNSIFKIKDANKRSHIINNRLLKTFAVSCLILSLGTLAIETPIIHNRFVNKGIIASTNTEEVNKQAKNEISKKNPQQDSDKEERMALIAKIKNDNTFDLSIKGRLKTVQAICDNDADYLGLPFQVMVVIDDLDETTLASYCKDLKTIRIDKDYLENGSSEDILNSCLHEMYHAYQGALTDAYLELPEKDRGLRIFNDCPIYIYEMDNYKSGDNDEYYKQWLEVRARDYANQSCERYYNDINKYLNVNPETY